MDLRIFYFRVTIYGKKNLTTNENMKGERKLYKFFSQIICIIYNNEFHNFYKTSYT